MDKNTVVALFFLEILRPGKYLMALLRKDYFLRSNFTSPCEVKPNVSFLWEKVETQDKSV